MSRLHMICEQVTHTHIRLTAQDYPDYPGLPG